MRENVLLGPAGDVEQSARREEIETGLGERHPALAVEPLVEFGFQRMQVTHVARCIIALRIRQLVGTPIAALLLFRNVDVEQLLDQILEAMAVGIRAYQARGSARAIERRGHDAEICLHDADVESREVIELQAIGITEQRLQVRRGIVASTLEPHKVLVPLAVRQLYEAQAVATWNQPHRLS